MRTCGIIGASLLSLIAVPALAFAILFYGFAQIVLGSPAFVAKLEPANLEAQLRKVAPYIVASALEDPTNPDSQALLDDILPDPGMRAMATELMPLLLAGTSGDPSADLLSQLDTQVAAMYAQAPACSADAEQAYAQALAGTGEIPGELCRPSDPALQQQVIGMTSDRMRQLFAGLSEGPLPGTDATTGGPEVMGQDITQAIATTRANAGQGFVIPLTLMVLVLVLAVRSLRELLGWSGGILFFAGLIGLGIAFASGSLLAVDWQAAFSQELKGPELSLALIVFELFDTDAFGPLVAWLNTVNGGLAVGGLVSMVVSMFIKRPVRPMQVVAVADPFVSAIPSMSGGGTQMPDPGATQPIPTRDGEKER
jgi:hypothetical protein